MRVLFEKIKAYADFIKIEHTLFALPFAYSGAFLASGNIFSFRLFLLIFLAFTGLRSAAMSLNRIIDRHIDALNPRTANRHLPAGLITLREAYLLTAISLAVYFTSAYLINWIAFMLSPIPAITVYVYPYLKRFTCLTHYFLGLNLALAPLGGWIAVKNSLNFDISITLLSISVMFWVSGFDIIYALQDIEFDRKYGLHSIGACFGIEKALMVSGINHAIFFILLSISLISYFGFKSLAGIAVIAFLLLYEHLIVRRFDRRSIQIAFFNINAVISLIIFLTILFGVLIGSR